MIFLQQNYYPKNIYPEMYPDDSWWDRNISQPISNKIDGIISEIGHFIKVNLIEVIFIVCIASLIYAGIRLFFSYNKGTEDKSFNIIYVTLVFFIIARLFWKVVFNV